MRTSGPPPQDSLATALLGKARAKVLAALLLRPELQLHVRELARVTGLSAGSLHRELKMLAELGLLLRQDEGRQVYYRANVAAPVYAELSVFLRKTLGLADLIRDALAPLGTQIEQAYIYGSMASGDVGAHSDVDVMVVGTAPFADVVKALHPLQQTLGREINPTVMTSAEYRQAARAKDGFVPTVLKAAKIGLIEGDDGLGQPGKDGAAQAAPTHRRRVAPAARGSAKKPGRRSAR